MLATGSFAGLAIEVDQKLAILLVQLHCRQQSASNKCVLALCFRPQQSVAEKALVNLMYAVGAH